jgi:hypothetical protein
LIIAGNGQAMKPKTEQELLAIYDALPSLFDIVAERANISGGDVHMMQENLRAEYRAAGKPLRVSMQYLSLFSCMHCDHTAPQVKHILENPPMKEVDPTLYTAELSEEDIHEIRQHGVAFSTECRRFLSQFDPSSAANIWLPTLSCVHQH